MSESIEGEVTGPALDPREILASVQDGDASEVSTARVAAALRLLGLDPLRDNETRSVSVDHHVVTVRRFGERRLHGIGNVPGPDVVTFIKIVPTHSDEPMQHMLRSTTVGHYWPAEPQ